MQSIQAWYADGIVLVDKTLLLPMECRGRLILPPIAHIARLVVQSAVVVKAVGDLVR